MNETKPNFKTGPIKDLINELRSEQTKTEEQIKILEKKIADTRRADEKKSPKTPLISKMKTLNSEIKELRFQKAEIREKLTSITDTYGDMGRPQGGHDNKYSTIENIESRLKKINLDMLKYPHTPKKVKEFEDEIKTLKIKKINLESEQKKNEVIQKMRENYFSLLSNLKEINKQLREKSDELSDVKAELDELNSKNPEENPVLVNYKNNIDVLRQKIADINEKINANRAILQTRREEYSKYLQQKELQSTYIKRRKEIQDKIKSLEEQKENFEKQKLSVDNINCESLIFALNKNMSDSKEEVKFNIDVVLKLTLLKVKIPASRDQIKDSISEIKSKREAYNKKVSEKMGELEKKIDEINDKIFNEKTKLEEIPVIEIKQSQRFKIQ